MPGIRGETWWLKLRQEEGREREGGEDISSFSVVRSRPSSGWKTDGKSLEFSLEAALSTISFFLSFFSFLSFFLFRSLCTPPFFFHLFFFFPLGSPHSALAPMHIRGSPLPFRIRSFNHDFFDSSFGHFSFWMIFYVKNITDNSIRRNFVGNSLPFVSYRFYYWKISKSKAPDFSKKFRHFSSPLKYKLRSVASFFFHCLIWLSQLNFSTTRVKLYLAKKKKYRFIRRSKGN